VTDRRLILDVMLGKLATYLRMCGYDAVYALDDDLEADDEILARTHADERMLVTRDRDLAAQAEQSICLQHREIEDQLQELADAGFDLALADTPVRCSACNGPLISVDRARATPEYAPDPASTDVWRCEDCGQHFWKGSHWDDVRERLDDLRTDET
jgi:uncharacterized protein with PIN domain